MRDFLYPARGRLAGWLMLSFVAGVAIHSSQPYRHPYLPFFWTFLFFAITLGMLWFHYAKWQVLLVPLLLFGACCVGIWRFDISAVPKLQRIDNHLLIRRSSDASNVLERWRALVTARIESALPQNEAALVTGMMYGDQDLSKDQRALFRSAGLMHLVAVSGSNVTVVVQCLSFLMIGIGLRRRHAFYSTTIALFLFVGFVGFTASVARAAFMGWLILTAREVGRLPSAFRLLLVAATILLFINPWQLAFDAGFALSFLAMWGLLAWSPLFEIWLARVPERFSLRSSLCMTLAATLMTAPYLAWIFHRLSFAGLVTNILALPLVPFIMASGAVVAAWGSLPGFMVVRSPAFGFALCIEYIARLTELFPWSERLFPPFSLSTAIGLYVSIVYFYFVLRRKTDFSTDKHAKTRKKR